MVVSLITIEGALQCIDRMITSDASMQKISSRGVFALLAGYSDIS